MQDRAEGSPLPLEEEPGASRLPTPGTWLQAPEDSGRSSLGRRFRARGPRRGQTPEAEV